MDRILSAPEPDIRAVLVALCDDGRLRARSHAYLDQLDKYHAGTTTTTAGSDPPPGAVVLGKRKKPSSFPPQICIQCASAFSPDANHPGACLHHQGRLAASPDPDDTSAGVGADGGRGLAWSCCGAGDGAGPGCARGLHVAVRGEHKRVSRRGRQDAGRARTFEGRVLRANEFVNENRWDGPDGPEVMVDWGDPSSGIVADHDGGGGGGDDDYDDDVAVVGDDDGVSERTERDSGGGGSDSQDEGD